MLSFDEFLSTFKFSAAISNSKTAKRIYEEIICLEKNRIEMVWLSDHGLAALNAVVAQIEELVEQEDSDLDLSLYHSKQTIGRMVSHALFDLGYLPEKQGRVLGGKSKYFTTAKVYSKTGKPTETIVPAKIVKIESKKEEEI